MNKKVSVIFLSNFAAGNFASSSFAAGNFSAQKFRLVAIPPWEFSSPKFSPRDILICISINNNFSYVFSRKSKITLLFNIFDNLVANNLRKSSK